METGHGHSTVIRVGEQAEWGVAVPRIKGFRVLEESLQLKDPPQQKAVLGYTSQHVFVPGKRGTEGGLKLYLPPNGGELWLHHALGAKATVQGDLDGGGHFQTHTFTLAKALPAGLSIEADRDAEAVGTAWLYDSQRINKFTLGQTLEDGLTLALEFLGREEMECEPTTEGVTYAPLKTFDWDECTVKINDTEIDLESLEITSENALDGDRHKLGTNLRKGISRKEVRKVSGKLEGELDRKDFYNLYRERAECALVALWRGRLLGKVGGVDVFERLKVTLPRIKFSGDTPNAKDAGRIKLTLPFVAAALLDQDNTEMSVELINVTP
jgi:hypothetical protein